MAKWDKLVISWAKTIILENMENHVNSKSWGKVRFREYGEKTRGKKNKAFGNES